MRWRKAIDKENTMGKLALVAGFAAGALFGATVGRKKVNELTQSAKRAMDRPAVRERWRKANRFVAEKAPTLHGVSSAVVDSVRADSARASA